MSTKAIPSQNPTALSEKFDVAFLFASNLHRTQRRKGSGTPYIAHLMAVCSLVLEAGGTEDQAIAALLHDAVEDGGGAPILHQIRGAFGDDIANIVAGCTDTDQVHKPSWCARKKRFLAQVPEMSYDVRLVMSADKLHNVRSLLADYRQNGEELWSRFTGAKDGTLWYYITITDRLRDRLGSDEWRLRAMTEELELTVAELIGLAGSPDILECVEEEGT